KPSMKPGPPVTTSAGASELIFAAMLASWMAFTLLPVDCANAAARSRMPEMLPWLPSTVISAACAAASPSIVRLAAITLVAHAFMTSSDFYFRCVKETRPPNPESRLERLHMRLAQQRRSLRRDHELDQRPRRIRLFRDFQHRRIRLAGLVE